MAGRPKKKPEYNPELQFNNFLQELKDAYEEADSLRTLADELNISLLKLRKLLITADVFTSDMTGVLHAEFFYDSLYEMCWIGLIFSFLLRIKLSGLVSEYITEVASLTMGIYIIHTLIVFWVQSNWERIHMLLILQIILQFLQCLVSIIMAVK